MPWFTPAFNPPAPQAQPPAVIYHTAAPAPAPQAQPPAVIYHTAAPAPARVMKLSPVAPASASVESSSINRANREQRPLLRSALPPEGANEQANPAPAPAAPASAPAHTYYSSFNSLGFSIKRSPRPSTSPEPAPTISAAPPGTPAALTKIVYLNQRRDDTFAAALQILAEQIHYQFDNETSQPTPIPPSASISWMPTGATAYSDLKALAAARPSGLGMLIIVNPASRIITLTEKAP